MIPGSLLCLTALLGTAYAYGGYLTGHEYVYSYEGSVFEEYNAKHHQHSGFIFKSKVHIQPHDDYFVIKINELVYDKANVRVVGPESYEYNLREHPEINAHIEKPFKVYFDHGIVKKIVFSRNDASYSVNLKKGLASLLQLNLDHVNVVQRYDYYGRLTGPDTNSHYFKAMEVGVTGDCETLYEIGSDEDAFHAEPVFNVTKSRNYKKCDKMPYVFYHSNHYDTCSDCAEQDHPLHLSDIYYYNMKGNRMSFVIERVDTVGELYFTPYTIEGERPSTQANRTLRLLFDREIGANDEAHFLEVTGDVVTKENLLFEFPYTHDYAEIVDMEKPHYLYHLLDGKDHIEDIGKDYLELVKSYTDLELWKNIKERKGTVQFLEIVKSVSTLSLQDIQDFHNQYVHKERAPDELITKEQLAKYNLFMDVLAVAGTNPAILFFKRLVQKNVLPKLTVEHFLEVLPQSIKEPHEVVLDAIYRLCEKDIAKLYPRQKSTCYLALSSIVYENCVSNYYEHQKFPSTAKRVCTPEDAVKYFNYIVPEVNDPLQSELDRVTAIKSAGNFGLKKSVHFLKKYIHHFDFPTYYRVSAIIGLRRTAKAYPELVREILVPVYFNHSEPNELRIMAYNFILKTNPDLVLLDTIGQSLHREQSRQVTSYVYSSFWHFAHSDYPCFREIKKKLQVVLRHLEHLDFHVRYDLRNSFAWVSSGYDEKYDFGGASVFSYITSNDSYVPTSLYYGSADYVSGKHYETFSIAYHGFGLDKFFDRIFGPEGLGEKKSLFDIFKRRVSRDTASVEKELKEIDERLHVKTREYEPVHGDISIRVFGNEMTFFHFDESLFENFVREGALGVPDFEEQLRNVPDFTYKRFVMGKDHLLFIPLEVGLPAYLNYKEPAMIYYHNNNFKLDVQPSIFADKRDNQPPTSLHLGVDGFFIHDQLKQATLGVYLPFEKTSIGVGRVGRQIISLPVNFDLVYDLKTHKATFKSFKNQPYTLLHKCSYPVTFINDLKNHVPLAREEGLLPYYKKEEMKKFEFNWLHDYLGYGLRVEGYHGQLRNFESLGSIKKFIYENDLRHKLYYLAMDPYITAYDVDVRVTPDAATPSTEADLIVNYDHYDSKIRDNKPYRSETSEAFEFEDGSEDHIKNLPGRKFYTDVWKAELQLQGGKERKALAEISYTHSCDHQYQKLNVYYDRSPFSAQETEHFKICLSASLRFPEYDMKKLYNLDTLDLDQKINAAMVVNFGKSCKTDKKITVRGVLKRSEEQIRLEQNRGVIDPLHYNPYAHYYKLCLKDRESRGQHYSIPCRKYIYYATKMHRYLINIEMGEMSESFLHAIPKVSNFVDHSLYYYMEQERHGINNEVGKENIEIDFSVTGSKADIHLQRPHDDTRFWKVPIPRFLTPLSASPYLSHTNWARYSGYFKKPFCSVEGDYVRTFDNVSYHLPEINCYKVLAKDCSAREYFTVLGKKTTNLKFDKALKAFIGKTKVEILAVTDDTELIVRVNGLKVDVTQVEPYFYRSGEGERQTDLFHIVYNGLYYTIYSEHYGVVVYFDGKAIITELSPYYRGKQCGLCGDFNNERHLEFQGPEQCVYHNVEEFAYSYAVPQEGCNVLDVHSACERASKASSCKTYKNKYIYFEGRQRQICFSKVPLPECATHCKETRKVTQNLGFHCINAKDSFARFLQRESRNRVLHELKSKTENHFAEIEYPEDCTPSNV